MSPEELPWYARFCTHSHPGRWTRAAALRPSCCLQIPEESRWGSALGTWWERDNDSHRHAQAGSSGSTSTQLIFATALESQVRPVLQMAAAGSAVGQETLGSERWCGSGVQEKAGAPGNEDTKILPS